VYNLDLHCNTTAECTGKKASEGFIVGTINEKQQALRLYPRNNHGRKKASHLCLKCVLEVRIVIFPSEASGAVMLLGPTWPSAPRGLMGASLTLPQALLGPSSRPSPIPAQQSRAPGQWAVLQAAQGPQSPPR